MQGIAQEQSVDEETWIEIRSRWTPVPATAPLVDLHHRGLRLLEQSRILRLGCAADDVQGHHLDVLANPRTEIVSAAIETLESTLVDVFCLPGVTDAEGEMASRALGYAGLAGVRCHAGVRYRLSALPPADERRDIERLFGNPIIHRFHWADAPPFFAADAEDMSDRVTSVDLRASDDADLLRISAAHHLALDVLEMRAIAGHFRALGRPPTDVELQSIALAWSEHCSHKTFRAAIDFAHDEGRELIPGLLRTYLAAPTATLRKSWVRSAFVDNAGTIAFDARHDLAFKVETHNHPSALEPYGGAHTGVGGVIRDVLAVSAEPIANTDVLCFGPADLADEDVPAGVFHPRRTRAGVVRGVADYGNNMGIPTVGGAILYHPGYTANPLVFCGTLGIAPRHSHPIDTRPGDLVVLLGGRTGRDGLHGATMSSASLDRQTVAGSAVQIGAPITEKTVRDVLPLLRDEGLYHGITDCGAGGLCSAVGEMAESLGVEVFLDRVPLKYHGLRPWEIWLSEAQERMVLSVGEDALPRLLELCRSYSVEATVIGRFRRDGLLRLYHGDRCVADMHIGFMHGGRPECTLEAHWHTPVTAPYTPATTPNVEDALLTLLAHPNIASKEETIRRYDHEVGGATVIKPLVGRAGPSDAAVLQPLPRSKRGVVVAHGLNPLYGAVDPHGMALLAVDEALRNLVAVGGSIDRAALLDNFCWGDVDDAEELGALVRAAQGCRDAALAYGTPFICGKDSLRNTSEDAAGRHSIPRTLLISATGIIPDVRRTATMDIKAPGNRLYVVGLTREELGCSHYLWTRGVEGGTLPQVRTTETPGVMRRLTRAIRRGLLRSCHDISEGGLAVAAAEMALAGGVGLHLDLDAAPAGTVSLEGRLFSESPGRWLAEVAPDNVDVFEAMFAGLPCAAIGTTTEDQRFVVRFQDRTCIDVPVSAIDAAWKGCADG
ncbi:MAG: phosphoribosylformylglycinamidine synthase subunit PurL [Chloroflexota bacterium]